MSKPETWKSWEGRMVDGKFPLRQYLGGSDHSGVFLTHLPGPRGEKAAIKLIQPEPEEVNHQLVSLRATARLSHPHLIRTIATGRVPMEGATVLYMVMEHADDDLSQILPQRSLEADEIAELLPPVLDALSYLHNSGFVHGRIKPSNVLAVGNVLKLSADQVAPATEQDSRRRRRDVYDAPETAAGIISAAGDIWSVGVTIVAALTQNVALAEEATPGNRGLPDTIPEPFRGIARECLHLDPKRRCSLAQIQARLLPAARSVPAAPEEVAIPARSSKWRPVFGVTLAVVVAAAIGFAVIHSRGKKDDVQTSDASTPPATQAAPTPASPIDRPPEPAKEVPPKTASNARGEVLHQVLPDVPQSAKNTITGTIKVVVRVQVDPSGKVTSATFKSPGPSRYFSGLAMKAAQRWEFSAPVADGRPTSSAWLLQFRFRRTSTQASLQQVSR